MCKITIEIDGSAEQALAELARHLGRSREDIASYAANTFLSSYARIDAQQAGHAEQRIHELSLSNAQLKELAHSHAPPREWFESDDNPFQSE